MNHGGSYVVTRPRSDVTTISKTQTRMVNSSVVTRPRSDVTTISSIFRLTAFLEVVTRPRSDVTTIAPERDDLMIVEGL